METEDFNLNQIVKSAANWASSPISLNPELTNLAAPSIESFPPLELKALPKYLKYVYLGKQEILPVIIMSHLIAEQEESLMSVFKKYGEAIGWTMTDIRELSPIIV